ncbi:MAG: hypothetical protein JO199_06145 [Candidatus Eremiobacteraeota bacterium]|nr:hypothetical protein [Candidatus Eremiobacteraeota bacterium]
MRHTGLVALAALIAAFAVIPANAQTAAPSPAAPATSATPAPTPTPDPAVVARAKSWFKMLQSGTLDRTQLDPAAAKQLTDAMISQVSQQIGSLGDPVTFEQMQTAVKDGSNVYVYELAFGNSTKLLYVFAVDQTSGKITGFWLKAAQ